jgi:hypothetical protein
LLAKVVTCMLQERIVAWETLIILQKLFDCCSDFVQIYTLCDLLHT